MSGFIDIGEHLEINEIFTSDETVQSDETPSIDPIRATDSGSDSGDGGDSTDIGVDLNDDTSFHCGSPVSLHKSAMSLLRVCRTVNLNKRGVKHSLHTLHDPLPMANKLP